MKTRTIAALVAATLTVCGASAASKNYLRFTARGGSVTIGMVAHNASTKNPAVPLTLEWSDNPEATTWQQFVAGTTTVALSADETAYFRQFDPNRRGLSNEDNYAGWHFKMTAGEATPSATVEAGGNVLSLIDAACECETVATNGLSYLFSYCKILTTPPELPATKLETRAYFHMFDECAALTRPPNLPAMKIGTECYSYLFYGCRSLQYAPALPATTLASSCYGYMFRNCTSLVLAPHLPATTLVQGCYQSMFAGCSNLKRISVAFKNWKSGDNPTKDWVADVASSGRFIKPSTLTSTMGTSNIPSGWTTYTSQTTTTVPAVDGLATVAVLDGETIMPTRSADGAFDTFVFCNAENSVKISCQPEDGYSLVRLSSPVACQSAALQFDGLTVEDGQAMLSFAVKTTAALDGSDWQPATVSNAAVSPDGKTVTLTLPATAAQGFYQVSK